MKISAVLLLMILNIGTMYTQNAPEKVTLPELGLTFTIPEGWTGQQYDESIILGHQTFPGLMILFQNESKSANELKELAQKGIVDEGVNLQANGPFMLQSGERVEGEYKGVFQNNEVRAFAIGLINGLGNGMNIIVLTSEEKFTPQHIDEASKLAASVVFSEAKDAPETTEWKLWLVGKKLKYVNSSSSADYIGGSTSMSDTVIINLYENGTFYFYSSALNTFTAGSTAPIDNTNSSGDGFVGGQDETIGSYQIYTDTKGSFLELHFKNDTYKVFELGTNSEKQTTLNGTRYYVTSID